MSHSVEYNSADNIVESHIHGETDLEELKEIARTTMQIISQTNCFNILTDLSDAHLNASMPDLFYHPQSLAEIIKEAGLNIHLLKRAFVISEDNEAYNFYENVAVNRGHAVMLFRNVDEARKWLSKRDTK